MRGGLLAQAKKAAEALAANTRAMNEVFATLKRFGIPDKAIQTSEFSVEPQYASNRDGNAGAKITGYTVSNTVNVTAELPKVGPALDALVSSGSSPITKTEAFKAIEIISAISKGFSPGRACRLLSEDLLQLIDIRDYAGKSTNSIQRIKGRIIGKAGKSRKTIEELTGAYISVYGHTVGLIGSFQELKMATEAITMISKGSSHKSVYNMLQVARRKAKFDKMKLWEENSQ